METYDPPREGVVRSRNQMRSKSLQHGTRAMRDAVNTKFGVDTGAPRNLRRLREL